MRLQPHTSPQRGISSRQPNGRSLATHLYDAGILLRQILEIMGHTSLASLTNYLDIEKRAAGNALLNFFAS